MVLAVDDSYELDSCILLPALCIQRAVPMAQTVSSWPVTVETPDPPGVMVDEVAVGQAFLSRYSADPSGRAV